MDHQHYLLHLPDLDHDGAAYIYVNYKLLKAYQVYLQIIKFWQAWMPVVVYNHSLDY